MDVAFISPRKTSLFYLPKGTRLAQQRKPVHTSTENFQCFASRFFSRPYFGSLCHRTIMYMGFKKCVNELRSISDWLNAMRYPCAKSYNSSAFQWLSEEQVRMCSGHPKVHSGTIVVGSGGWGWRGEQWVMLALSLYHCAIEEK